MQDRAQERKSWIDCGYTDAEAIEVLRCADSGVRPDLSRHGYRFVKRAFDIVASGAAIALLLIPGIVLSTIICIKSPGAGPLYSQLRVGRLRKDGTFRLFRKRTVPSACSAFGSSAPWCRMPTRCSTS